jgi:ABC-2 type transport system ATP-binding protein
MTPVTQPVIQAKGLTRRFADVKAVDRLELQVEKGEIFGLVGPDGAGKTTTLRLLCGLLDPSAGSASIAGFDVASQTQQVKDRIGYMAQRFGLYGDLTVQENMDFYADLFGLGEGLRQQLSHGLLAMTRMEPFRNRPAAQLSGGMKQKLALVCTLLHKPEILFLDEPTNGVDPVSRRDFWAILYQLVKDGLTVFVTTAYLDEAERCNRVGLMNHGRMIACSSPSALKAQLLEECYELTCADLRATRVSLAGRPGVLSVEPSGSTLHVFLSPALDPAHVFGSECSYRRVEPSLEDVFIAMIAGEGLHA